MCTAAAVVFMVRALCVPTCLPSVARVALATRRRDGVRQKTKIPQTQSAPQPRARGSDFWPTRSRHDPFVHCESASESRPRLTNRLLADPGTPGNLRVQCRVCVSADRGCEMTALNPGVMCARYVPSGLWTHHPVGRAGAKAWTRWAREAPASARPVL